MRIFAVFLAYKGRIFDDFIGVQNFRYLTILISPSHQPGFLGRTHLPERLQHLLKGNTIVYVLLPDTGYPITLFTNPGPEFRFYKGIESLSFKISLFVSNDCSNFNDFGKPDPWPSISSVHGKLKIHNQKIHGTFSFRILIISPRVHS